MTTAEALNFDSIVTKSRQKCFMVAYGNPITNTMFSAPPQALWNRLKKHRKLRFGAWSRPAGLAGLDGSGQIWIFGVREPDSWGCRFAPRKIFSVRVSLKSSPVRVSQKLYLMHIYVWNAILEIPSLNIPSLIFCFGSWIGRSISRSGSWDFVKLKITDQSLRFGQTASQPASQSASWPAGQLPSQRASPARQPAGQPASQLARRPKVVSIHLSTYHNST